ncbi:MAG: CcmD family protein [Firmicutes bacterium]|nr:CcmD family protein [Bacillota bacterium]
MTMTYLFLAYTAFWLLLAGYLWSMAARQRRLAQEVADLSAALKRYEAQDRVTRRHGL